MALLAHTICVVLQYCGRRMLQRQTNADTCTSCHAAHTTRGRGSQLLYTSQMNELQCTSVLRSANSTLHHLSLDIRAALRCTYSEVTDCRPPRPEQPAHPDRTCHARVRPQEAGEGARLPLLAPAGSSRDISARVGRGGSAARALGLMKQAGSRSCQLSLRLAGPGCCSRTSRRLGTVRPHVTPAAAFHSASTADWRRRMKRHGDLQLSPALRRLAVALQGRARQCLYR